ncbi:MAG: Tex-like N-terminal domain-containing protein, partial [Candidatus Fermentibacterota bacterium]
MDYAAAVAGEIGRGKAQVRATLRLLEDGATVPFIARYRKERTGGLDEVEIAAVRDGVRRMRELDSRRESILESLRERDLLTA